MEFNLADLFESVVDVLGDATAVVSGERRLSYEHLDRRANRLADHLRNAGIGAGDRVGLQLFNGSEYLEGMLACFKIRAIPININYRYVAAELRYLYADAGLVGLIVDEQFASSAEAALGALADQRSILSVGASDGGPTIGIDYEGALAEADDARLEVARSSDDLYCVYTGGTTGMPKGVLWRHEDIFFAAMGGGDPLSMGNAISAPDELSDRVLRPGIVALAIPPFMHASGHWLAFSNMFGGGTVVTPSTRHFDAETIWDLAEREKANAVVIVGDAMAKPLLDALATSPGRWDLSSVMAVGSGGALLSPSTKQRLSELLPGRIVADLFGSSETGQVGGEQAADDPFGAPRLRVDERTNVLDDDLRPLVAGSGQIGRLARSGRVPVAYLGDEEKSATTFVESQGRRWSLPGDLATVDEGGMIRILGRGSLSINTGGEKVFPDEVEGVLKGHPDVVDAVVVGLPDDRFGEQVCAVISLAPGQTVETSEIVQFCEGKLSSYKTPRLVIVVDEMHRSPSGKADYPWARASALEVLEGRSR